MKTLKVKSTLFSLLAIMAIAVFLVSCKQDSIVEDELDGFRLSSLLAQYPEEITIDNWEEFVYAPQEVIDYHQEKELSAITPTEVGSEESQLPIASRTPCGFNGECGFVKAFNSSVGWDCLGGVDAQGGGCSTTSFGGCFNMSEIEHHVNYAVCQGGSICMSYQTSWLNGVSTLDLVLIQKHRLGLQLFTDVRQYIAADIDGNGTLEVNDLHELRKLILGIYIALPDKKNIVFLAERDYDELSNDLSVLDDTSFLLAYTNYGDCDGDENRYAIKTGDINGSFNF